MNKFVIGSFVLLLSSAAAYAQDGQPYPPPSSPEDQPACVKNCGPHVTHVFDGFHAGAFGGYESNNVNTTSVLPKLNTQQSSAIITHQTAHEGLIGANIGYDKIVNEKLLVGAELGLSFNAGKNRQILTVTNGSVNPPVVESANIEFKADFTFEATVRAGYLATDKTLLYMRGGYVNSKLNATVSSSNISNVSVSGANRGYLLGGGVEQVLAKQVSLRVEYRHLQQQSIVKRDQIVAGLNFYF